MNKFGIDLSDLAPAFDTTLVPERTLILDGDGPCYVASATSKTMPTALRRFQTIVMEEAFLSQCGQSRVHLTAEGGMKSGRHNIIGVKPYQGNRSGKDKPALLEALRQQAALEMNWVPNSEVILHRVFEADDGMMQDAYQLKDNGVIRSDDKDLRMTPYPFFEPRTGLVMAGVGFGSLWAKYTPSGLMKAEGQGIKFFWLQMLMGDSADNVKGILKLNGALCGPKGALDYLENYKDETTTANAVIDAYRVINQNPIPEGWFLWMLRHPRDTFWQYLGELELSAANRSFINECVTRTWFRVPADEEADESVDAPMDAPDLGITGGCVSPMSP